ncbi:MAG: MBOAT family protein [Lachnospiraceae bacterium]|nr:MBOAT family protein [Lachnospiraceae bacterium]
MLFSSLEFIFRFLPIFLIIYYISPGKIKNVVILLGSLVFYACGEPLFVALMLALIIVNFLCSKGVFASVKSGGKGGFFVFLALLIDLGSLFLFKYYNFFAENINYFRGEEVLKDLNLTLPLGISFYTFQMISYVIDVRRGEVEKVGLIKFGTYVSMFPQLVAGPILRYKDVEKDLVSRKVTLRNLENGLVLFSCGLGFKVLLANKMSILWNDVQNIGFNSMGPYMAWLGALAFTFEILFDFWGYSVMAMGLGEMLGFKIPRNFDAPYMAKTMGEFWRRWHMTLGRFFKDYVYIPMGGSRKSALCTVRNLFIVWALTGIWHGAGWNFVIWGVGLFVIILLEKLIFEDFFNKVSVIGHMYMWVLIPISWMVFEISDINSLWIYLQQMFFSFDGEVLVQTEQLIGYLKDYGPLFIICIILMTKLPIKLYELLNNTYIFTAIGFASFWYSVYELARGLNNPFLYFRF